MICMNCGSAYESTSYEGRVLGTYEDNGYHDSYWYAVVWDDERNDFANIEYDSTAHGGRGRAVIDATDETVEKALSRAKDMAASRFDGWENEQNAKAVRRGDHAKVVRGRKVPVGTSGKVFWTGEVYNQYSREYELRAGLETDGGKRVFLPAAYLLPDDWESRMLTGEEREEKLEQIAVQILRRLHINLVWEQ